VYEITQQINIHVLDASAPPAPPNTGGFGTIGGLIAGNIVSILSIIAIVVLVALAFGWLRHRKVTKFGLAAIAILLLSFLTLQFTNFVKADPILSLNADLIDVTITKPATSTTATSTLIVPAGVELYDYNVKLNSITDNRISIELNGITLTNSETLVASDSNIVSYTLDYTISITNDLLVGDYVADIDHDITEKGELFKFTIDTRMTDTLFAEGDIPDTNPAHFAGTATLFRIPTGGRVNGVGDHAYDWIVNCGDGQPDRMVSGTGSLYDDNGIICNYSIPGQYQITIKPNGPATPGWLDAFGFSPSNLGGAHIGSNKNMFKSIDTPFTNNMRTPGSTWRFALMFSGARNATSIPAKLFRYVGTSGATNLTNVFSGIFEDYAYNNTTGTIPAGLLDSINTGSAMDLSRMFLNTFYNYAHSSTIGTIPAGLFDSIDTSSATNLSMMFSSTFRDYAYNSTVGTIPAGLLDSINTGSAMDLSRMFLNTFYDYAHSSTIGTIPAGLFDSISTSSATNLIGIFSGTFANHAYSSTAGIIPAGLFDSIDISGATNLSSMFDGTFQEYAYSSTIGTIPVGLFDSINTSSANGFANMFSNTFNNYAYNSTTATIPAGLFDSINTSSATSLYGIFNGTFSNYAHDSTVGTIPAGLFDSIDISSDLMCLYGACYKMFSFTFNSYAFANKLGGTPDTDINDIWGNANLSNVHNSTMGGDTGSEYGTFWQTFYNMPSLTGTAQTFIDNKLDGKIPIYPAYTFTGTGVTDLASLDPNWK